MYGGPNLTPNEFLRKVVNICRGHNGFCTDKNDGYICPLRNFCAPHCCIDDIEFLQKEDKIDEFVMAVYEAQED